MSKSNSKSIIKKFSYLPQDMIIMILSYLNIISYRTGKFIDKIKANDVRYKIFEKIPRPICIDKNQYYIGLRANRRNVIKIALNYIISRKTRIVFITENYIGKNGMIYSEKIAEF